LPAGSTQDRGRCTLLGLRDASGEGTSRAHCTANACETLRTTETPTCRSTAFSRQACRSRPRRLRTPPTVRLAAGYNDVRTDGAGATSACPVSLRSDGRRGMVLAGQAEQSRPPLDGTTANGMTRQLAAGSGHEAGFQLVRCAL